MVVVGQHGKVRIHSKYSTRPFLLEGIMEKKEIGSNGLPTKGSNLAEQIYLMMKDCFFPSSGTMGDYWKKTVLCEFIQNSGMPLGFKTVQDATTLTDAEMKYAIDNLKEEGYIEEIDSPASFLFPGTDGSGYQLKMNAKGAENAAQEQITKEAVVQADKVSDPAAEQMALPNSAADQGC